MNPSCHVSFVIACYNAMPYLDDAVGSALAQEGVSAEVLIVDDGSTDGSLERARVLADADPRVRVLQTSGRAGPGGARNLALAEMKGAWFAVLDTDDFVEPQRSAMLIAAAEQVGADLIADDLRVFGEGIDTHDFLAGAKTPSATRRAGWIELDRYFRDSAMYSGRPNPGFLKPMIRRTVIEEEALRYDPNLRIAEDDALIVRLLLAGRRYYVVPKAMYHYRKHAASISHRLSLAHAELMMQSETAIRARLRGEGRATSAYRSRWRALQRAVAFTRSIDQLKHRQPLRAALTLLRRPDAIRLYAMPLKARLGRTTASR